MSHYKFKETDLVTHSSDYNLIFPWGLLIDEHHIYVVQQQGNVLTRYDLDGKNGFNISYYTENGYRINDVGPTGIVKNPTDGFLVSDGKHKHSSTYLICAHSGDIFGYNKKIGDKAYRLYAGSVINPIAPYYRSWYKGLAVRGKYIFAADFLNGKIDVLKDIGDVNSIELKNSITKYGITAPNFASPFNVVFLNDELYVLYAYKNNSNDVFDNGTGGFIDIHNKHGVYDRHFNNTDTDMKSPYGLIKYHDKILVTNYGSGKINVYNDEGKRINEFHDCDNTDISINGLLSLYKYHGKIYFTATGSLGVMGYIRKCKN
jgi:uncharacterized protein (TIGR03118 family)